jgi:hypothetical protein
MLHLNCSALLVGGGGMGVPDPGPCCPHGPTHLAFHLSYRIRDFDALGIIPLREEEHYGDAHH